MFDILVNVFINIYFRRQKPKAVAKYMKRYGERLSGTGITGIEDRFREAEASFETVPHEEVSITSADGLTLRGRLYVAPKSGRDAFEDSKEPSVKRRFPSGNGCVNYANGHGFILLAHGFRSSGERDFGLQFEFLRGLGMNILVIDQRTHGRSEGKYVTLGSLETKDVKLWADYILSLDPLAEIVLYGVSMGATACCGAACLFGEGGAVKGIVADCGFASPYDEILYLAGGEKKPFIKSVMKAAVRNLVRRTGGDPREPDLVLGMTDVNIPALFVHGLKDTFVPPRNTLRVFEACGSHYKRMLTVEDAGHAEAFMRGEEEYRKGIEELMEVCFR